MKCVKKNKGIIIFYLLLVVTTIVVINVNERKLIMENEYVYLTK